MSRPSNLIQNDLEYLRNTTMPRDRAGRQEYLMVFQRVLADATGAEVTANGNINSRDTRAAIQSLGLSGNPRGVTPAVLKAVVSRADRVASGQPTVEAQQQPDPAALSRAQEAAREATAPIVLQPQSTVAGTSADLRIQQGTQNLTNIYGGRENMQRALESDLAIVTRAVEGGKVIGDRRNNDSPETVAALQRLLIAQKHSGRVQLPEGFEATGRMDDATRDAVRQMQKKYGERGRVAVDGIVGRGTLGHLTFDIRNQILQIGEPQQATPPAAAQGPEWEPLRYGNHPDRPPIMVVMPDGSKQPIMRRTRDGAPGSNEFQHDIRLPEGYDRHNPYSRQGIIEALAQTNVNTGRDRGVPNPLLGGQDPTPSNKEIARPARARPERGEQGEFLMTPPEGIFGFRRPHQMSEGFQSSPRFRASTEMPTRHVDGTVAIREGDGHENAQIHRGGGVYEEGPSMRTRVINLEQIVDQLTAGNNIISAQTLSPAGQGVSAPAQPGAGMDGTQSAVQALLDAGVQVPDAAKGSEAALGALVADRMQATSNVGMWGWGDGGGPGGGPADGSSGGGTAR